MTQMHRFCLVYMVFWGRPEHVVVWLRSAIGIWRQAGPVEDKGFNQNGHRVLRWRILTGGGAIEVQKPLELFEVQARTCFARVGQVTYLRKAWETSSAG